MGACAVGVVTEVKGIVLSHQGGIRLQPGIKKTLICHKQKLKDNTVQDTGTTMEEQIAGCKKS